MRVLVCGGRHFSDFALLAATLDALRPKPTLIIQGGARGADTMADYWAFCRDISRQTFWADWERDGKRAGPLRNQRMLDVGKPQLVVAFPGGRGTADMVRRARAAGIEVRVIP